MTELRDIAVTALHIVRAVVAEALDPPRWMLERAMQRWP